MRHVLRTLALAAALASFAAPVGPVREACAQSSRFT